MRLLVFLAFPMAKGYVISPESKGLISFEAEDVPKTGCENEERIVCAVSAISADEHSSALKVGLVTESSVLGIFSRQPGRTLYPRQSDIGKRG